MCFEKQIPSKGLKRVLDYNSALKALVEKSIRIAASVNPDEVTNPCRSLSELYGFLDYSVTCPPWNIFQDQRYNSFSTKCNQSILYVYWLLDQPLDELKGMSLFYPSVQYLEPVYVWLKQYNNTWRDYLDTEEIYGKRRFNEIQKQIKKAQFTRSKKT